MLHICRVYSPMVKFENHKGKILIESQRWSSNRYLQNINVLMKCCIYVGYIHGLIVTFENHKGKISIESQRWSSNRHLENIDVLTKCCIYVGYIHGWSHLKIIKGKFQ